MSAVSGLMDSDSKINIDDFKSCSLSPRVKRTCLDEDLVIKYDTPGEISILRFLINRQIKPLDKAETNVFTRSFNYLTDITSAEETIKGCFFRSIEKSNIVLVDICEKREGSYVEEEFHTICLWKKHQTEFLIIDPSNHTFSDRLVEELKESFPNYTTKVRKYYGEVFYKSLNEDMGALAKKEELDLNDSNINKDFRDCIDIALKIALSINFHMRVSVSLEEVEEQINLLSNQKKINTELIINDDNACLGWLQSSDRLKRERVIRLLYANKGFTEIFAGIDNIDSLQKLDKLRLLLSNSSPCFTKDDIIKMIKDTLSKKKVNLDIADQFLDRWITVLKLDQDSKRVKDELKEITKNIKVKK